MIVGRRYIFLPRGNEPSSLFNGTVSDVAAAEVWAVDGATSEGRES